MEEKKLLLSDFLNLCVEFESDPTEERQKSIDEFLSNLSIREYIPLSEKAVIALYIISEIDNDDYDVFGVTTSLEMTKFFKGLIYYAVNLVNDVSPLDRTYACYDTCMKYGLYDKIASNCDKDYQMLLKYVDDAINVNNIMKICRTTSIFNDESRENFIAVMDRVDKVLTPELLDSLADFNTSKKDYLKEIIEQNSKKELLDDKRTLKQVVADNKKENE